jgi:V-type H+-transporting ATPase subunit a
LEGFFQAQCEKFDISVKELPDDIDMSQASAPSAHEIDVLEENCQTNEQRLSQLLDRKQLLERRHAELIELRHVLGETARYFEIVTSTLEIETD